MKTIEVTLYKFDELSDKAKEFAVQDNIHILTDFGSYWYETLIWQLKDVGISAGGFDLERREIEADFYEDLNDVCANVVKDFKGSEIAEMCANYLTSVEAQLAFDETDDDMLEDMEMVFIYDLKCELLNMFQREYDYLTDADVIADYLLGNEFDFDIDGKIHF
jgi:hypothetical protein